MDASEVAGSSAVGSSPLDAVRESFETVAADYAQLAKPMFEAASAERALLAAFADRVREDGTVACLGAPGNAALRLYEGLGFRAVSRDTALVKWKAG